MSGLLKTGQNHGFRQSSRLRQIALHWIVCCMFCVEQHVLDCVNVLDHEHRAKQMEKDEQLARQVSPSALFLPTLSLNELML